MERFGLAHRKGDISLLPVKEKALEKEETYLSDGYKGSNDG
jgi:hypothetical protein